MAGLSPVRAISQTNELAKGLAGFRSKTAPELHPSGVGALDSVLGGGFPRGSLVEVCGPGSSGRSSLGFALLAQATGHGEACAFIDVSDSLDPVTLAAAGVDVSRLLWIRCGEEAADKPLPPQPSSNIAPPQKTKKSGSENSERADEMLSRDFSWRRRHPRNQLCGIEDSIPQLMGKKAANNENQASLYGHRTAAQTKRISIAANWKEEQVETDRQLPRRGENIRRHPLPPRLQHHPQPRLATYARPRKPWKRLEQALKAADLLLHSGGWGVVVFDLGSISWVDARRIPLSTWFRFQRTIENTPTILLLLAEDSCAKSCASVVLRCQRLRESWDSAVDTAERRGPSTLQGFEVQGEIVRSRTHLQKSSSASWETQTIWNSNF